MHFPRFSRYLACFLLPLVLVSCSRFWHQPPATPVTVTPPAVNTELLAQDLVPLAQPGPWPHITELIGYGDRLWFSNSVAFENHNSADLYSYAPATGETRYERHLFSQGAGQPMVADGLLYWPFEDPRFASHRGEYMVTNGKDWQWHLLAEGEAFHVHTMATDGEALFAGTGAWAGRLQKSQDSGQSWEVVYEYPTPDRQVSRITQLAAMEGQLYVGVTALHEIKPKVLRWEQDTLKPITSWPEGKRVDSLTAYNGWLYGINLNPDDTIAVWRTQGDQSEPVTGLDGYRVRAFAAGEDAFWAVSSDSVNGLLWHSPDGLTWTIAHEFKAARPLAVAVYAGQLYVGAEGKNGQGVLFGPTAPGNVDPPLSKTALSSQLIPLSAPQLQQRLAQLEQALSDPASYSHGETQAVLAKALTPLALTGMPEVGAALSQHLNHAPPQETTTLLGGELSVPVTDVMQWYLLWAIGLNGSGPIPVELLSNPWAVSSNNPEKYWQPAPAAAWAMAQIGQGNQETIDALIQRLSFEGDPIWLKGDWVGALSVLTRERFGYDEAAWQNWWSNHHKNHP